MSFRQQSPEPASPRTPKPSLHVAISSLEAIRNLSDTLMRDHHQLHNIIEGSYRALLGEGVQDTKDIGADGTQSTPTTPTIEHEGWKSEREATDSFPTNIGAKIAEQTRIKQRLQAARSATSCETDVSGLPDFVKQNSGFHPLWSLHPQPMVMNQQASEDNDLSEIEDERGSERGLVSQATHVTDGAKSKNEYCLHLANDFAIAQGWIDRDVSTCEFEKSKLQRWVEKSRFEGCCTFAIIANSMLLGAVTDYGASNAIGSESDLPAYFRLADVVFSVWFLIELIVRLAAVGPLRFWSVHNPLWTWNYFDTFIVMLNSYDHVMRLFDATGFGSNATGLRTVRILRVARAMRIFRVFRFFRTLRMMVLSMLSSFTALLWAMVLLAVIMFTFAIFLTQNVSKYLYEDGKPVDEKEDVGDLKHYYGGLIHTFYTLFLSISGGISWVEVSGPLFNIDTSNGLIFCFFIFTSVFAMLNIITGIFLDTAIRAAQADKDESIAEQLDSEDSTIKALQHIFNDADVDNSGEITSSEFESHLSNERVRAHLASLGVEAGKASALFRLLDLDDSGSITVDEFLYGCMRLRGGAKGLDVATLMYENKRLMHKWIVFMTYVEKQFKYRKRFEDRLYRRLRRTVRPSGMGRYSPRPFVEARPSDGFHEVPAIRFVECLNPGGIRSL